MAAHNDDDLDEQDYEVGYRKPPKNTRFKQGESGNKKGRPKGSKNTGSVIRSVIDRKVTIREDGKLRRVDFMEAFVQRLVQKALNGNTNDQLKFLRMIEDYVPGMLREAPSPLIITTEYILPKGKTVEDYKRPVAAADPEGATNLGEDDESWLK